MGQWPRAWGHLENCCGVITSLVTWWRVGGGREAAVKTTFLKKG